MNRSSLKKYWDPYAINYIYGCLMMPVFESYRKVQVFGSSLAFTLPAFFLNANQIEKGSLMNVHYGFEGVLVLSQSKDLKVTLECLTKILEAIEEKNRTKNENEGKKESDV